MSCKLELELCGYEKDNCTRALEVCDFDCSDGENGWLNVVLLVLIGLGIYYFFWIYRPKKKKQREQDRLDLATYRSQPRQTYTDNNGNSVVVSVDPRVPELPKALNQPIVF